MYFDCMHIYQIKAGIKPQQVCFRERPRWPGARRAVTGFTSWILDSTSTECEPRDLHSQAV